MSPSYQWWRVSVDITYLTQVCYQKWSHDFWPAWWCGPDPGFSSWSLSGQTRRLFWPDPARWWCSGASSPWTRLRYLPSGNPQTGSSWLSGCCVPPPGTPIINPWAVAREADKSCKPYLFKSPCSTRVTVDQHNFVRVVLDIGPEHGNHSFILQFREQQFWEDECC